MANWTEQDLARLGLPVGPGKSPGESKYRSRKKEVDGILFDSCREALRYRELKALERFGAIRNLRLQPRFLIQEKFQDQQGNWHRRSEYVADFQYVTGQREGEKEIVEDTKGYATEAFRLKWKLVVARYPEIEFRIVK